MFHIEELYYYYTSETSLNFCMINNSYCDCILTPDAMPTCISLLLLMLYIAYIIPFKFYSLRSYLQETIYFLDTLNN
jgi:membrane-anchored glycerophosphoryl diester phosphodiesterase (GDPDase)